MFENQQVFRMLLKAKREVNFAMKNHFQNPPYFFFISLFVDVTKVHLYLSSF